jgi:hypothetical protein
MLLAQSRNPRHLHLHLARPPPPPPPPPPPLYYHHRPINSVLPLLLACRTPAVQTVANTGLPRLPSPHLLLLPLPRELLPLNQGLVWCHLQHLPHQQQQQQWNRRCNQ